MSTSIHQGRVRLPADVTGAAGDDPVGAARVRDGIANGLLHFADEAGQPWVSLMRPLLPAFNHPTAYVDYLEPRAAGSGLEYAADIYFPVALFDIRHLTIGTRRGSAVEAYPLRVRVAGASADSSASVRFLVAPLRSVEQLLARDDVPTTDREYLTDATSSTNAAWLAGTSQGTAGHATMLLPTPFDTHLAVWASTTIEDFLPRLYGLAAAPFVGGV